MEGIWDEIGDGEEGISAAELDQRLHWWHHTLCIQANFMVVVCGSLAYREFWHLASKSCAQQKNIVKCLGTCIKTLQEEERERERHREREHDKVSSNKQTSFQCPSVSCKLSIKTGEMSKWTSLCHSVWQNVSFMRRKLPNGFYLFIYSLHLKRKCICIRERTSIV